jgi:hypothetical protein
VLNSFLICSTSATCSPSQFPLFNHSNNTGWIMNVYEDLNCVIFAIMLILNVSWVKIRSSALCSHVHFINCIKVV